MSAAVDQLIQFRCNKCWQPNYAKPEQANTSVNCEFCAAAIDVPEATSDRLTDRSQAMYAPPTPNMAPALEQMNDADLQRMVERENYVSISQREFSGHPSASHMSRFLAFVFDSIVSIVAAAVGIVCMFAAISNGLLPKNPETWTENENLNAMLIVGVPVVLATLTQWCMTACWGKTVGKLLTFTRIVTCEGKVPGVLRGVVLRSWVNAIPSAFIPFYGLIDILFIFGNSRRCLHDFLAGTRVVQD